MNQAPTKPQLIEKLPLRDTTDSNKLSAIKSMNFRIKELRGQKNFERLICSSYYW
jgi:hypothetical protein